jgi:hypothetical protein
MFYHALAAIPEWAPSAEHHILYSTAVLKGVTYDVTRISYSATGNKGTDYLRLAFEPASITLNGEQLSKQPTGANHGYTVRKLPDDGWAIIINRLKAGVVVISN